jgi:hypothetical protein
MAGVLLGAALLLAVPVVGWAGQTQGSAMPGHGDSQSTGAMTTGNVMPMGQMWQEMHSIMGMMSGMMGGMAGNPAMGMGQQQGMMGQQQGMGMQEGQGNGGMMYSGPMLGMTRSMNGLTGSMNEVMQQMQDMMNNRKLMEDPDFARGMRQVQEHMGMMMQGFDGMVHNLHHMRTEEQEQQ